MENSKSKKHYNTLLLCILLLFNPNLNVIDILPDFIAWFLLAKIFEKAADSASYFDEARRAFIKLGWITLTKIPAIFLIIFIRGKNSTDNDVFLLASIVFAVLEIIFGISAVKNTFSALYHLGERSDAKSLLTPIPLSKSRTLTPEALEGFTLLFLIVKSILSTLPDFFLLTRVSDGGYILTISKFYPYVLLSSITLGFTLGGIWLGRIKKYIRAIHGEGLFFDSLEKIATESSREEFEKKLKLRSIRFALSMFAFSSFLTLEFIFDNFDGINILPRFMYGLALICSIILIKKHTNSTEKKPLIFAIVYTFTATLAFIVSAVFLTKYDYLDLMKNKSAMRLYLFVEISAVLEFIAFILMTVFIFKLLRTFIFCNTGIEPGNERYRKSEHDYHKNLIKRTVILISLSVLTAIARLINVFLNRDVQLIFSDITDITRPTFEASAIPWFNLVITFSAIIYIGYSIYYSSLIKEEVEMKFISIH